MTLAQRIPASSFLGKAARIPLRLVPPGATVRVLRGPSKGARWIVGSGVHAYWLGNHEPETIGFVMAALRPGDVFLDVGANVGYFTLAASRRVGSAGRVIAFEPVPRNLDYLDRHVALNSLSNVEVVRAAVSDRTGSTRFDLGVDPSMGMVDEKGELEVATVTLDDVLMRAGLSPRVVKIDVEGHEPEVLRGAAEMLAGATAAVTLSAWPKIAECVELLKGHGYTVDMVNSCELIALPPGWNR